MNMRFNFIDFFERLLNGQQMPIQLQKYLGCLFKTFFDMVNFQLNTWKNNV